MPSRKLTEEQKTTLAGTLRVIEEQSASIQEHIEFIRDNAGLPPFAATVATPDELLTLIQESEAEFVLFAEYHVPIYLGSCLIDEFDAHWSVEEKPSLLMFGQPYVDGFGNIGYENVYLPMLRLHDDRDVKRFDQIRLSCQRAYDLRARFTDAFSNLSGKAILRSELEQLCVDRAVLPKGSEATHVWRTRVTKYAKLLKIKITRG